MGNAISFSQGSSITPWGWAPAFLLMSRRPAQISSVAFPSCLSFLDSIWSQTRIFCRVLAPLIPTPLLPKYSCLWQLIVGLMRVGSSLHPHEGSLAQGRPTPGHILLTCSSANLVLSFKSWLFIQKHFLLSVCLWGGDHLRGGWPYLA